MSSTKSILNIIYDVSVEILAGFISGFVLFLFFGGTIDEFLIKIYPNLPQILYSSIFLTTFGVLLYRLYRSVRFRRGLENRIFDLYTFLQDWDALNVAFNGALQTNSDEELREYEQIRSRLLYSYPRISSMTRSIRYDYIDRLRGIHARNYDLIGNFLSTSPFTTMQWFTSSFAGREWMENWDRGRTFLVYILGVLDVDRNRIRHRVLQLLRLVPRLLPEVNEVDEAS